MKYTHTDLENKLIDSHTHAGMSLSNFFDDKYPYCYSLIEIDKCIGENNFDLACVFPFPAYVCGTNIKISEEQRQILYPIFESVPYKQTIAKMLVEIERFKLKSILPFGMFSINYAVEEQLEYLEEVADRIYGLKYYPDADARKISELKEYGRPFLEYLIRHNLPLVFHVSENACLRDQGFSNVMDAIQLAEEFPKLRIAVAHMGHFSKVAMEKALELKLSNLYFDVSPLLHICHIRTINGGNVLDLNYASPKDVLNGLMQLFPNNLLWGSDMPFNFTCNLNNPNHNFDYKSFTVEENTAVLNEISGEYKMKMCSENVIDFLFGKNI